MLNSAAAPAYEGVLYNVFQQLRQAAQERTAGAEAANQHTGLVFAFTSANSGEGVTHTIDALLAGLVRDETTRALVVDSRELRGLTVAPAEVEWTWQPLWPGSDAPVWEMAAGKRLRGADHTAGYQPWGSSWEYRRDVLAQMRAAFDYVLIDCPALKEANDILSLAPFADGVILVIEADRTRKEQVLYAERSINFARGKLLGHILNKREYVVPEWLYRRI